MKPRRIEKPWGHELWWARAKRYVGKMLVVEKGKRLSLQYHKKKHETIFTLRGRLKLRLGSRTRVLPPGTAVPIPPGTVHRFEAPFGRVTLVEVSTPEVWDVVRLQDDYDRCPAQSGARKWSRPKGAIHDRCPAQSGARKWSRPKCAIRGGTPVKG